MNNKVDYKAVVREILKRRKIFCVTLPTAFLLASLYIICIPREYISETKVAPEMNSSSKKGMLGTIASSFGVDLSSMESADAITPMVYPNFLEDNNFIMGLSKIKLKSKDGSINTDFYTYMDKYQKSPWWSDCVAWMTNLVAKQPEMVSQNGEHNPYILSKIENDVLDGIRSSLKVNVDKKTGVITINTVAQDPLICKTIADSTREHLQRFIIKYRTSKVRNDYEYYYKITMEAKQEYEKARQMYGAFSDSNSDIILQSVRLKQEDLENDMQLKFNAYTTLNTQLQAAKAKIQESTPAFTLVKGASMPIKPSSPKRVMFVLTMTILAFFATSVYVLKDIVKI